MLAGFEVVPGNNSGSFIGAPPRVVLHTTEGSSADGAIGAYRANNSWPHFTVDAARRRKIEHLELDVAARALLHPSGTPETNRANAIQIELVGFAADTPGWSKDDLRWLATDVLTPIRAVVPFSLVAPRFVAYPASAGLGAAQRLTWSAWSAFSGILGHEHVPGNDHGDPGAIDTTTILAALGTPTPQPAPNRRRLRKMLVFQALGGGYLLWKSDTGWSIIDNDNGHDNLAELLKATGQASASVLTTKQLSAMGVKF